MMGQKHILFLSTHNLVTNPRLVKEIRLAVENNYKVSVICFEFRNWSFEMNNRLKKELEAAGVILHTIEAGRSSFILWLTSVVHEKISRLLAGLSGRNIFLAQAVSRRSILLISALKKIKGVDIVIGHNPGALLATYKAKKEFKCMAAFDVEDYHPGEGTNKRLQKYCSQLMINLLPEMDYVSFASDPIKNAVEQDVKTTNENWFSVLNYFPASEFILPAQQKKDDRIKMVWFSQNINASRGLELVIPFLKKHSNEIELHLFGNINEEFYKKELHDVTNIIIHDPLPQKELHQLLWKYDIGLALEPAKDKNNELAISNKLLAYLQAGLYIIATATTAQQLFMSKLSEYGICFDNKKNEAGNVLAKIIERIEDIRNKKNDRFENFKHHNWESESMQLLHAWQKIN